MKTYEESITYLRGLEASVGTELQAQINDALDKAIDEKDTAEDRWNNGVVPLCAIWDKNTSLNVDFYDSIYTVAYSTDPVRPFPTTRPK